jgi:hypothetical protein
MEFGPLIHSSAKCGCAAFLGKLIELLLGALTFSPMPLPGPGWQPTWAIRATITFLSDWTPWASLRP